MRRRGDRSERSGVGPASPKADHKNQASYASSVLAGALVSVWTTTGRLQGVRLVCSDATRNLLAESGKGETDLVHRDGLWLLLATCELPEPAPLEPAGFLGVDLGIVNIATTSDGVVHAGRRLNRYRRRQLELRRKLQRKKTKSANRVLKRQRRKESRRARDINHVVSVRHEVAHPE